MHPLTPEQEIDELIRRFYGAFDNRKGKAPEAEEISGLFVDRGIILYRSDEGLDVYSVAEFIEPRIHLLTSGSLVDFHEWETSSATTVKGAFATRFSTYEKSGVLDGSSLTGAGTKILQLVSVDGVWRIASLSWFDS